MRFRCRSNEEIQRRTERGSLAFTLIELLVVIAIISLLVSIMMPALKRAKEMAKQVKCLANLRGLGIALQVYAADWEGLILPAYEPAYSPIPSYSMRTYWPNRIFHEEYIDQPEVFFCPSWAPHSYQEFLEVRGEYYPKWKDEPWNDTAGCRWCYGMRVWVPPGESWSRSNRRQSFSINSIEMPGDFWLIADGVTYSWSTTALGYQRFIISGHSQGPHLRHSEKACAVFADAHAETKDREYYEAVRYSGDQSYLGDFDTYQDEYKSRYEVFPLY